MADIQVIISPAKKMRASGAGTPADDVMPLGIPPFPEASRRLAARLKAMDPSQLQVLWGTSDKLTAECVDMTRELVVPASLDEARAPRMAARLTPAVLTYDGIQFRSMAPEVLGTESLEWLQDHLWVLSGLHGCMRPLDAVMPYRLEMGARLATNATAKGEGPAPRNLYEFWGNVIARHVTGEPDGEARGATMGIGSQKTIASVTRETVVVNLASVEYAKAVLPHLGGTACVTCICGASLRGGKPVQRSTASKAARGSMVRWMAERALDDQADLVRFDVGYRYDAELSSPDRLVFMRA